jgi:hypothetical protein
VTRLSGTATPPATAATSTPAPAAPAPAAPAPTTRRPAAGGPATGGAADKEADLLAAVRIGNAAQVRAILERNPSWINRPDPDYGGTPLHWAASKGHVAIVSFLVSAGADVNAKNRAGETPLAVAKRAKKQEVVTVLSGLGETGGR